MQGPTRLPMRLIQSDLKSPPWCCCRPTKKVGRSILATNRLARGFVLYLESKLEQLWLISSSSISLGYDFLHLNCAITQGRRSCGCRSSYKRPNPAKKTPLGSPGRNCGAFPRLFRLGVIGFAWINEIKCHSCL